MPGATAAPVWSRDGFLLGAEKHRILEFAAAESHWSPELTALHEEEAGSNHPIDKASRRLAVRSLQDYSSTRFPVVLDVGCSSGYMLREIRQAMPEAALIGADYILPPLLKLAERMPDLPVLQFDLRCCPLPDKCVDAVTALNVLEHIDHDEQALAHIHRILRPGGIAHIEVPAGPDLFDLYDEYLMHHRRYRSRDLAAMARRVGFEILQRTHLGFLVYPAFWLVKKRNRRRLARLGTAEAAVQVKAHIRETGDSAVMAAVMRMELALSRVVRFPAGIRCVLVVRKRSS